MTKKNLILFALSLVLILALRFLFVFSQKSGVLLKEGDLVSFQTTVLQEPKVSGNVQIFTADTGNRKIMVFAPVFPQFHYGDRLRIAGKVQPEKIIGKQGILLPINLQDQKFITYFPKIEAVKINETSITGLAGGFLAVISVIRQNLISSFSQVLPPTSSALLLGIVFGIKDSMPGGFLQQLKISGVMHVIAASGMNVTMVAGFFSSVTVLFFKRRTALVISILIILFYAALAGFQASIIRASIMGIMVFSAQILGRQTIASYSLFLTGFIMLFINPTQITDIGFQLSFLSTAGLLYLQPLFTKFQFFEKTIIGDSLITTVCAQISTLPIMILNFGTYSIWSVAVNALVLWTIPPLMVLGGFGAIISFVFLPLGKIFLLLSLPFLIYFEKVVVFFSGLPGLINIQSLPWQLAVGYYLFLLSFFLFLKKKEAALEK